MKNKIYLGLVVFLFACTSTSTSSLTSSEVVPITIDTVIGLEDTEAIVGQYFHPLKGVKIVDSTNRDISYKLNITGHVDYSSVGTYALTYFIDEPGLSFSRTRTIQVNTGSFVTPVNPKTYITTPFMDLGSGSYRTGTAPEITHPVPPNFMELDLLDRPVPTNSWWTALAMSNYGGSNGIYNNPLRSSFSNDGVEITQSGEGFTQFWLPEGNQTIAQFSLALKDINLKPASLATAYQTRVIDYSDNTVKVAMRNAGSLRDHMVVTYNQGSPYIFAEVGQIDPVILSLGIDGVSDYQYFSLDGNLINTRSHTGDGLIIKMLTRHVGYQTNPPAQVGNPTYDDRYFVVNLPKDSQITMTNTGHPFGLYHRLSIQFGIGNMMSVAAINNIQEAAFYHQHGYSLPLKGHGHYEVDEALSLVHNDLSVQTSQVRLDRSDTPVLALLPHQHKLVSQPFSNYSTRTVRGLLKMLVSRHFRYTLPFNGVLPSFTLPNTSSFSVSDMERYLLTLSSETRLEDSTNFLNNETPYWNSKATYALSQGILIAKQLNVPSVVNEFSLKLSQHLTDWYTYSGAGDKRFLHYNDRWGTTYYSDNEFNTASEISDHSFTHGYVIFASAVLSSIDPIFYNQYKDMIDLLLKDYMNPSADDTRFPVLRSFDRYAGHSWAHGFGSFAEGNNLESTGEALNGWIAGYMIAQLSGDKALRNAAIYGYVNELYAAQQYWFDYDQDIWSQKYREYAGVAGIVWGGKYDYATWFGANPTFIYGIQWIPTGEYLTSYALGASKKARLNTIYNKYLNAKGGAVDRWFSYMHPMQAIVNPQAALSNFSEVAILNDEYPAELSISYWMIQALQQFQYKTDEAIMQLHRYVSSSVYLNNNNKLEAMIYNASNSVQTVTFTIGTTTRTLSIPANSFASYLLN
jgi:endo-1,3(4)-beta-glucanase